MQTYLEQRGVSKQERDSVVSGSLWMIGISLILFFLPAVNGLIGGVVGGYRVGSPGRALAAAILPAVIVGVVLWAILALFDAPVVGFFSGIAVLLLVLFSSLGLVLGAVVGGALSSRGQRSAHSSLGA